MSSSQKEKNPLTIQGDELVISPQEWDYLNNDVLSDMKTGAFETDGTDTVRDMIYQIIKNYCEFERDAASVSNKNDGKMNFKHFSTVLEQTKQKGGTLYQKLSSVIEDFV